MEDLEFKITFNTLNKSITNKKKSKTRKVMTKQTIKNNENRVSGIALKICNNFFFFH